MLAGPLVVQIMQQAIISLLEQSNYLHFIFSSVEKSAVSHLKLLTKDVPNKDGLYSVFADKVEGVTDAHLIYHIESKEYQLIYFGISGGETKRGKKGAQKLRARINNVVGSDSCNWAIYWNNEMRKNKFLQFVVFYCPYTPPKEFEMEIYLNVNELKYPLLNKKRGRIKKVPGPSQAKCKYLTHTG